MPTADEGKGRTPGIPVVESPQHGQPQEVIEYIAGVPKKEAFEDIPSWNHHISTLSLRCHRVTVY